MGIWSIIVYDDSSYVPFNSFDHITRYAYKWPYPNFISEHFKDLIKIIFVDQEKRADIKTVMSTRITLLGPEPSIIPTRTEVTTTYRRLP